MLLTLFIQISISVVYATDGTGFLQLSGPLHFVYHNFSDCAPQPTSINLTVVTRWLNKTFQVLDGYLKTPVPIGNNMLMKVAAYAWVFENWVHVTNISGKSCQIIRNYVGPSRTNLLSSIGFPPDTCPIPKGIYHSKNLHFTMEESRIPAFPYGIFKLLMTLHAGTTNVLELCVAIVLENTPL